jgi:hypothetical protein
MPQRVYVYKEKSIGPRTESCGTPKGIFIHSDKISLIFTIWE